MAGYRKLIVLALATLVWPATHFGGQLPLRPTVNLPIAQRQANWADWRGNGSCGWATDVSLCRWNGFTKQADWIVRHERGASTVAQQAAVLTKLGVSCKTCDDGDEAFLQDCCDRHYGAAVVVDRTPTNNAYVYDAHEIALVFFNSDWAGLLDNNDPTHIFYVPRDVFLREWRRSGGEALGILGHPPD